MKTSSFTCASRIAAAADRVYAWHARRGAFERLQPPWESVEIRGRSGGIEDLHSQVELLARHGPLRFRWVVVHASASPGREFRDVQVRGPFAHWDHAHVMKPEGDERTLLEDRIEYRLPAGRLGAMVAGRYVHAKLERMFRYRHDITRHDVEAMCLHAAGRSQRVLVSGSSGLIGSALIPYLTAAGHEVTRLVRRQPGAGELAWDPERGDLDARALERFDTVVHLAGENAAEGRWDDRKRARILTSRVQSTRLLAETLATLTRPPQTLVCASAIGVYGDRGGTLLSERARPGRGFLSDVSQLWEEAASPAKRAGVRVVQLRLGVVLSPLGGALRAMLPVFRLGLGGTLGSGDQFMSWIGIDDVLDIVHRAATDTSLRGAVNAVAPRPVPQREFAATLARVLGRPAMTRLPAVVLREVLGEMADEVLLSSRRVVPARLLGCGHRFRHPDLESTLRHLLGRTGGASTSDGERSALDDAA